VWDIESTKSGGRADSTATGDNGEPIQFEDEHAPKKTKWDSGSQDITWRNLQLNIYYGSNEIC
jgi:hypothetical protein